MQKLEKRALIIQFRLDLWCYYTSERIASNWKAKCHFFVEYNMKKSRELYKSITLKARSEFVFRLFNFILHIHQAISKSQSWPQVSPEQVKQARFFWNTLCLNILWSGLEKCCHQKKFKCCVQIEQIYVMAFLKLSITKFCKTNTWWTRSFSDFSRRKKCACGFAQNCGINKI